MSSANELKRHLGAVTETRLITNAMYLLSTSRMRRCLQNVEFNIGYLKSIRETIYNALCSETVCNSTNAYVTLSNVGRDLYIVLTSDRGLCSNYNDRVCDLIFEKYDRDNDIKICMLGTEGSAVVREKGIVPYLEKFGTSQNPTLTLAEDISEMALNLYKQHDVKQIFVIYMRYFSQVKQEPVCERILPLCTEDFPDCSGNEKMSACAEFLPDAEDVIDSITRQYLAGYIFNIMNESACSENIIRMNSMKNATDNADKMIEELKKQINAERQLAITNEITEIAAAFNFS